MHCIHTHHHPFYSSCRYFKDIRTAPLNFEGDISGDSSSDDEEDIPVNFLSYLRQAEEKGKTGYLLKRSVKDVNLWRRRLCLITDFYLWCIHAQKGVYKAKKIKLHGPVFLQDELLPLQYPLGFGIKCNESNIFFRAFDEEEVTLWTTELIEYCKNEEDNLNMHMADVLISLEEDERNTKCSDSVKSLLSDNLVAWLSAEMEARSEGTRDNGENRWTVHGFHSYHPLCGKAMGFILAVKEEYKGLFRKFIRPSAAAFWDCVISIYRRFIVSQILPVDSARRKQSLCYSEDQIPAEIAIDGAIKFYEPTYLKGAETSTAALQDILNQNVRWKRKEEILEEISLKSNIIREKNRHTIEDSVSTGWFAGWMAPRPVEVDINSDLDKDAHGSSTSDIRSGKSTTYYSKRYSCMHGSFAHDELKVSDYILLKGHDSERPELSLFDDLVTDVTRWLNSADAKNY